MELIRAALGIPEPDGDEIEVGSEVTPQLQVKPGVWKTMVQQEVGCKGWTAASSKTPPSEAAGSFPKQPNVTCNSELHHLERCVVRHTYTSLKGHVSPPRGHVPMSNCTFEGQLQVIRKNPGRLGARTNLGCFFRAGLELQNMHLPARHFGLGSVSLASFT